MKSKKRVKRKPHGDVNFYDDKRKLVNELHSGVINKFQRRHYTLKAIDELWFSDLIDIQQYARQNSGFRYILVCLDGFSKYLWTVKLKSKTGHEVADALQKIFDQGRVPKLFLTDHGREYYNRNAQNVFKKFGIHHYSTYTHVKSGMAERVIRTLKSRMYKEFSYRGSYRYVDILDEIVADYNSTIHSTTKMKPKDIKPGDKKLEAKLLSTVYKQKIPAHVPRHDIHVNDLVRISKQRSVFTKSYLPNFTNEVFRITHVKPSYPVVYSLESLNGSPILGTFYRNEILKTKVPDLYLVEKIIRKTKTKSLVKYLGIEKPCWELNKNIR